jgi:hypothetical protein
MLLETPTSVFAGQSLYRKSIDRYHFLPLLVFVGQYLLARLLNMLEPIKADNHFFQQIFVKFEDSVSNGNSEFHLFFKIFLLAIELYPGFLTMPIF